MIFMTFKVIINSVNLNYGSAHKRIISGVVKRKTWDIFALKIKSNNFNVEDFTSVLMYYWNYLKMK